MNNSIIINKDGNIVISDKDGNKLAVNDEVLFEAYERLNSWGTLWEYLGRIIAHDTIKARLYCLIINKRGGLWEMFHGWEFFYPTYEEVYNTLRELADAGAELPWKLRIAEWKENDEDRIEVVVDLQKFWEEQEAPPVFMKLVNELAAE